MGRLSGVLVDEQMDISVELVISDGSQQKQNIRPKEICFQKMKILGTLTKDKEE